MRIRKSGAMDEAQTYAICTGSHGNNAIRRPIGRAVAEHEEVVVVVGQLVCGRETLAERLAHRTDQGLMPGLELGDEALELPFRPGR